MRERERESEREREERKRERELQVRDEGQLVVLYLTISYRYALPSQVPAWQIDVRWWRSLVVKYRYR